MFVDCVLYARHSSKSFIFNVLLNYVRTFGVGGFPRWLSGKWIYLSMQWVQETSVRTLARKIPWRRKWQPTPISLPGEYHGLSSLGVTVQEVTKELDMAETEHTSTQISYREILLLCSHWSWEHWGLGGYRASQGRAVTLQHVQDSKLGRGHPAHSRFNSR